MNLPQRNLQPVPATNAASDFIDSDEGDEIHVVYPEQVFQPHSFCSFRVGNLSYKTFVRPGETKEDAYKRAWLYVEVMARDQFKAVHKDYWERYWLAKEPPKQITITKPKLNEDEDTYR